MADIHVQTGDGTHWQIVMHLPVPNQNNAVAVNYRNALVNSGIGGSTVLTEGVGAGQITTAEKDQIAFGELYEHVEQFRAESGGTSGPELQAALRQFYVQEKAHVTAHLQRRLRYFGHTESEV